MWAIVEDDCRAYMATLADCSIDSIVTDPPYELGFMGRKWDSTGIAFDVDMWRECLRVLKPGGHLITFGGQRTIHRIICAAEDAGFDVRDLGAWQYWSGFPKSLDVSKAIDKARDDTGRIRPLCRWLREAIEASDLSIGDVARHFGVHRRMVEHWAARDTDSQPTAIKLDQLAELAVLLRAEIPDPVQSLAEELNGRKGTWGNERPGRVTERRGNSHVLGDGHVVINPGEPVLADALKWQGWGTALKPCLEPWALLRKPFKGTVASNVLKWGTGGLNIDGCRYAYGDEAWPGPCEGPAAINAKHAGMDAGTYSRPKETSLNLSTSPMPLRPASAHTFGRWPANVYVCPKPSTAEREIGCEHLAKQSAGELVGRKDGSAGIDNPRAGAGRTSSGRGNIHPTVKPIALMQWLCRLVTKPGGTVLDPFAGSGTTGIAAMREGFSFIGVEMDPTHCEIARCRIRGDAPLLNTMQEDHGASLPF